MRWQPHGFSRYVPALLAVVLTSPACGDVELGDADDGSTAVESVSPSEGEIIAGASISQTQTQLGLAAGGTLTNVGVSCPAGSVIVGGGYVSPSTPRIYSSRSSGNSWVISAYNPSSTTAFTLFATAQCLKGTNATSTLRSAATTIPAGGSGCAFASCSSGEILAGGGFAAGNPFQPSSNQWLNGQWQVCGKNSNVFQSISMKAYANCLSGVTGGATRQTSPSVWIDKGKDTAVVGTACPSGTMLSSGGYQVSTSLYPRGSQRISSTGTLWVNYFTNLGPSSYLGGVTSTCLDLWP